MGKAGLTPRAEFLSFDPGTTGPYGKKCTNSWLSRELATTVASSARSIK
jgi:hypothetical protein